MAGQQGVRAGKAFVELYANRTKLTKGLKLAQRQMQAFGRSMTMMGLKMTAAVSTIAAPLTLAVRIGAEFEDQMSKVKAVTGATNEEFEKLSATAKELGRTTSFTASQVAEAMVGLGRAGFDPSEIDKAIESILALSRATDTEMAEATDIAGAALRQFKLEANEMGRVSDVLTAAVNNSAQTLTDMGEALKPVGPIAAEAGESIEETAAAIGVLANNGIKGSLAGSALARAYKNLSSEAKQNQLKEMFDVDSVDAAGNLRPLAEILRDLGMAVKDLGSAERLNAFEVLFGRGAASAAKLAGSGGVFDDLLKKLQEAQGAAKKTAKEMDDNLGGSLRMMKSALEGVAIAIKDAVESNAKGLIDSMTVLLGKTTEWIQNNEEVIRTLVGVGAKVGIVGVALTGLGLTISTLGTAIGLIASPWTLAVAAIAGAIKVFVDVYRNSERLQESVGRLWESLKNLATVVLEELQGPVDDLSEAFSKFAETLLVDMVDGLTILADWFSTVVREIDSAYESLKKFYDLASKISPVERQANAKNAVAGIGAGAIAGENGGPGLDVGGFGGAFIDGALVGNAIGEGNAPARKPGTAASNMIGKAIRDIHKQVRDGALSTGAQKITDTVGGVIAAASQRSPISLQTDGAGTFSSQFSRQFAGFGKEAEKISKGDREIVDWLKKIYEETSRGLT